MDLFHGIAKGRFGGDSIFVGFMMGISRIHARLCLEKTNPARERSLMKDMVSPATL